jgi:large subunit ribosomal protein L30
MDDTKKTKPAAKKTAGLSAKKPAAAGKAKSPKEIKDAFFESLKGKEKIAIIRIRGTIRTTPKLRKTFELLNLDRQNSCSVFEKTPSIDGMTFMVKDFSTFGIIDDETFRLLIDTRAQVTSGATPRVFFRLNPPKGGFERKGIKYAFNAGGALGDRKEKISELIKRML